MDRASGRRSGRGQYLVLYNFLSALLWFSILGRVVMLVPLVGTSHVYGGVGHFAKWTQTLALLEIGHSLLGLVRSPLSTTMLQVSSRLMLVWGIVDRFPDLAQSPAYSSMLLAWSITEVIRYAYFVMVLRGGVPDFLAWLRYVAFLPVFRALTWMYNTFYVLYPLGISSEMWLVYKAIKPAGLVRAEYQWLLRTILLAYVPGSYILYTHMMAQRRKIMRGKKRLQD
ncbi:MAG: hypothetical protein M1817_005644 [Caeruleum heppii]|nr:MAG: hypothetical protein M1817_005644 [Caeruleum heppii]